MLAEGLLALATLAGNTVVTAAVTDAWEAARDKFARLLGRGDPDKTELAAQRLAETHDPEHPFTLTTRSRAARFTGEAQTSGSALCETWRFCTALLIFHREEVSRYGTQQKIFRHGAPMDEEF